MIVDILILITLWLIACAVCFAIGFFVGLRKRPKQISKPPPEPLTEEQERKIKKMEKEIENFWAYDGTEQSKDFNA